MIQLARGPRGMCGQHRRADIPVLSNARTLLGSENNCGPQTTLPCCGQECPRALPFAGSPRCARCATFFPTLLGSVRDWREAPFLKLQHSPHAPGQIRRVRDDDKRHAFLEIEIQQQLAELAGRALVE